MIKEIDNKYTPEDLKNKINELINNYSKFKDELYTKIDHKVKNLQNEINQKQAKNDKKECSCKKEYNPDDYYVDMKIEYNDDNKYNKLEVGDLDVEPCLDLDDNREHYIAEYIDNLKDIILQKEKELAFAQDALVFSRKTCEALSNKISRLEKEKDEYIEVSKCLEARNKELIKRQKPKIDDDAICKIVMEIFQIYADSVTSWPYIQPDGI